MCLQSFFCFFSNFVFLVALSGSKTKVHLFCFLLSFLHNAFLVCVFLMSRTIYQNLVRAKIAKLDIYLLPRSLFILTVGKEGRGGVGSKRRSMLGFPGGAVVESLPANAGDTGSSPGLGRSHVPRSD